MSKIVYLDQNAWVALARGSWDKSEFPREHAALTKVVESVRSNEILVPLSFANIYETAKINDPVRRATMARAQSLISRGRVFRGRRRILTETLAAYIAEKKAIEYSTPDENWFLSDLWFEGAGDYTPANYGFKISERVLDAIRRNPGRALFDYLAFSDEAVRVEAVRRYSAGSADLLSRLETRRALVAGEPLALRRRAYGARLILDELDFIFETARGLGLEWSTVGDLGSSLVRSMTVDVPILNIERELVIRLEDQARAISENDLRDMTSFTTVIPFADVVVAEKPFVNLARQARLGEAYSTELLTSVLDL
jgi:hypothetical protein